MTADGSGNRSGDTSGIWRVRFHADAGAAKRAADTLLETEELPALAVSAFEDPPHPMWIVDALYDAPPDRDALLSLIGRNTAIGLAIEPLENEDWVAKSLEGLRPVTAGPFFVHGAHDAHALPPGRLPIRIEAGQAFGTGHHGTTAGCLQAMAALARRWHMPKVLDLGCGSGVLAIAAAKLWRARVWASDMDRDSVAVTRENIGLNGAQAHIRVLEAMGTTHSALHTAAPYDLILANILARPLIRLAPDIFDLLQPGGFAILSGLTHDQVARVLNFYRGRGMLLVERRMSEGWAALTLRKP